MIEEDEKHRVKYGHFDIRLDQSGQIVGDFSGVDGLEVGLDVFQRWRGGAYRERLALRGFESPASGIVWGAVTPRTTTVSSMRSEAKVFAVAMKKEGV